MPPASNPLRLQIIDRIVAILSAITTGSDYFFTPGKVAKRFMYAEEIDAYPCYMVTAGEKGGAVDSVGLPNYYDENFTISIRGVIKDDADTVTKCEQALADVRKAINADSIPGAPVGSLHELAILTWFTEGPDMDEGFLSLQGYGYFNQRVTVRINETF